MRWTDYYIPAIAKLADQSLMPTGLLDKMSEIEVIELLKFLLRSQ